MVQSGFEPSASQKMSGKGRAMVCIILAAGLRVKKLKVERCFVNERGHTTLIQGLCSALSTWEPPHVQPGCPKARPQPTGPVVLKPEHTSEPAAGFSCGDVWALLPVSDAGMLRQARLRICISNKVPVMQRLPVGPHLENH